jgi:hypothetical protein
VFRLLIDGWRTAVGDHDFDGEEGKSAAARWLVQSLDWIYSKAVEGIPGAEGGIEHLARSHQTQYVSAEEGIDSLVVWQIAKAGAAGFVTNLGGVLTLPVGIPANLASVLYIQIRMIGAIAHLRGYDVRTDQVKTLVLACLMGSAIFDILKDCGIKVGTQFTRQIILRISGDVLKRINQTVGFRLVTKAGSRGIVNLVRVVPFVGGVIGGGLDAVATKIIGETAKQIFFLPPSPANAMCDGN